MVNKLILGSLLSVVALSHLAVAEEPTDRELMNYARREWNIAPHISNQQIQDAFDANLYGVTWRHWVGAFSSSVKLVNTLNDHGYGEEFEQEASSVVGETVLTDIVDGAVGAPKLVSWATYALSVGINLGQLKLEVEAFRHQHNLYFEARPFNSAQAIASLAPFDFLNSVDVTKEGRGWLFNYSGYLTPYPTSMSPSELWPITEAVWQMSVMNATDFQPEIQLYSSNLRTLLKTIPATSPPILIRETPVITRPSANQVKVTWSGEQDSFYVLQTSTDMKTWTTIKTIEVTNAQTIEEILNFTTPPKNLFVKIYRH